MIDYPVTAIQVGALALGYTDPIHLTDEQLENVKNLYIEAKKNGQFRTFFSNDSEIVALFHTGEVSIALGYPGNALDSQREGDPVEFADCQRGPDRLDLRLRHQRHAARTSTPPTRCSTTTCRPRPRRSRPSAGTTSSPTRTRSSCCRRIRCKRVEVVKDWTNILPAAPPAEGYDQWIRAWQEVKRS